MRSARARWRNCEGAAASPRSGPLLPVLVADQPVELIGDFGQVLIGALLVFGAGAPVLGDLFFDFDKSFTALAEKAGLLPFNFEHDRQCVLDFFDRLLEAHFRGLS